MNISWRFALAACAVACAGTAPASTLPDYFASTSVVTYGQVTDANGDTTVVDFKRNEIATSGSVSGVTSDGAVQGASSSGAAALQLGSTQDLSASVSTVRTSDAVAGRSANASSSAYVRYYVQFDGPTQTVSVRLDSLINASLSMPSGAFDTFLTGGAVTVQSQEDSNNLIDQAFFYSPSSVISNVDGSPGPGFVVDPSTGQISGNLQYSVVKQFQTGVAYQVSLLADAGFMPNDLPGVYSASTHLKSTFTILGNESGAYTAMVSSGVGAPASAVPEPAISGLFALGLTGVFAVRRSVRRQG